jgi:hypothetical protein
MLLHYLLSVAVVTVAVGFCWLRMVLSPVYSPGDPPPRASIIGMFVGLILRPGIRITRGRPVPTIIASWLFWIAIVSAVCGAMKVHEVPWKGWPTVYGLLCGVAIGLLFLLPGFVVGMGFVKVMKISSFEGASGYAVVGIALLFGLIGWISGSILMTLWFNRHLR